MTNQSQLYLTNCSIIDATYPNPRRASILVEGDTIKEVRESADSTPPENAEVIDLNGAYLLPGLWDVHTHLGRGIPDSEARDEPMAERTIRAGRDSMRALSLGITSLRAVGERHFIDVAWKRAFESGLFVGPTIYACGYFLTTTAGHFLKSGTALELDGPVEFRNAIREQIKNGVDFIKLNLTGGVMGPPWDGMPNTFLLPDEIEAAFGICHQRGYKIAAHAGGTDAIKIAARNKAHTIEHGYQLDDEAISLMVENDVYYVPTLGLTHLNRGSDFAVSEYEREWSLAHPIQEDYRLRAIDAAKAHAEGFQKAIEAGVKIACGSDLALPDGGLLEIAMLVRAGMTPWQAIVSATQTSAEACCVGSEYGTIEAGKKADLIALADNPLDDIDNVRSLKMVVKGGKVVQ